MKSYLAKVKVESYLAKYNPSLKSGSQRLATEQFSFKTPISIKVIWWKILLGKHQMGQIKRYEMSIKQTLSGKCFWKDEMRYIYPFCTKKKGIVVWIRLSKIFSICCITLNFSVVSLHFLRRRAIGNLSTGVCRGEKMNQTKFTRFPFWENVEMISNEKPWCRNLWALDEIDGHFYTVGG